MPWLSLATLPTAVGTLVFFPWNTDSTGDRVAAKNYFGAAYKDSPKATETEEALAVGYPTPERIHQFQIEQGIPRKLEGWIERLRLRDARVLEVGAGHGFLQNLVANYTGLDLSPTARRFFHKPFVEASATAMPFPDGSFDAVWSVWVLEHIPDPEKALTEMRRVLKPGGYLLLEPAYDVSRFAAEGYPVRPYRDLDWSGKLAKATIVTTESRPLSRVYRPAINTVRYLGSVGGETRLRFTRLAPNYRRYWMSDSDAAVSFSYHELMLWFQSRNDVCMNCPDGLLVRFLEAYDPMMVIRKRK